MRKKDLIGIWMVTGHKISKRVREENKDILESFEENNIEGAEFEIEHKGYVLWKPHVLAKKYPYMEAKAFSLNFQRGLWQLSFFTSSGQSIEFTVKLSGDVNILILKHETGFKLECQKISNKTSNDAVLSLKDALMNTDFADVVIFANNGRQFKCHKCILSSIFPEEDWNSENNALSCLKAEVIEAILYYAYCGCLPEELRIEIAREMIDISKENSCLSLMSFQIAEYLDRLKTDEEMQKLISELEGCLENICQLLQGAIASKNQEAQMNFFNEEPHRVYYLAKQIIEQFSVGVACFLLICETFIKNRKMLSRGKAENICEKLIKLLVSYAEKMKTSQEYLKNDFDDFGFDTTPATNLAEYLLPQIEELAEFIPSLQEPLEQTLSNIVAETEEHNMNARSKQSGNKFFWKLKNALHMGEVIMFNDFADDVTEFFEGANQMIDELKSSERLEKINLASNAFINILTAILNSGQILTSIIDNGNKKRGRTFLELSASILNTVQRVYYRHICAKQASNGSVCTETSILVKLRRQQNSLGKVIEKICEWISNETFNFCMKQLGLLQCSSKLENAGSDQQSKLVDGKVCNDSSVEDNNITSSSPTSNNLLARSLESLLSSSSYSDLEFIISEKTNAEGSGNDDGVTSQVVLKAHRVIVATRCEWFRRALGSGMKESIDRTFHIEDCSPRIFKILLRYLYCGYSEDLENYSAETLADLMTITDRYEVGDLMHLCERRLMLHINDKNVFTLLSLADSIAAQSLKDRAFSYIKMNRERLKDSEDIKTLSDKLKEAVLVSLNS